MVTTYKGEYGFNNVNTKADKAVFSMVLVAQKEMGCQQSFYLKPKAIQAFLKICTSIANTSQN
jgi:hypothetical protein